MTAPTTTKLSMTIQTAVRLALESEAQSLGRDFYEHIQRILSEHAMGAGHLSLEDEKDIRLMWSLVERAVEAAKQICHEGGFNEDITLRAIERAKKDPKWSQDYEAYVRDDMYKNGNPRKGPINREIGFRIREGIGGAIQKDSTGKPISKKVLGEIIQSYSAMKSFDPKALEA